MRLGGFEPPTRGLEVRGRGKRTRRQASTNALNHAGFRACRPRNAAWLREPVPRRLGH